MTYTQLAIKRAHKSGWRSEDDIRCEGDGVWLYDKSGRPDTLLSKDFLLDLSFWQCLGKAEGWLKYTRNDGCSADNPSIEDMPHQGWMLSWKHEWIRLIDYLAAGKTTEDFFKITLKK